MNKIRIIARLDIKNEYVIKGIQLEGLRKIGAPNDLAKKYYQQGIDEIIFMDAVAAYYDRNSLSHIIEQVCQDVFVPLTVGGGIRSIEDIQTALNAGADKVAINTQAVQTPAFIKEASKIFGSQCVVSSIDAKKKHDNKWEVYTGNGREATGLDVLEWAKKVEQLGAGELMLTSVDMEGTKKGFDTQLNHAVSQVVSIPIISCGGAGTDTDVVEAISSTDIDAVALASILHYNISTITDIKKASADAGVTVRI